MFKKIIKIKCSSCKKENKIPTCRLYDGFDGDFACIMCGDSLELLNDALDDG